MKKVFIILIISLLAGTSMAQRLAVGTQEVKLSGTIDFKTAAGTLIDLDVFYGVFVMDYLEVGGVLGVIDDDARTIWRIGAASEYNIDLGSPLVPYVGLGIYLSKYEIQVKNSDLIIATEDEKEEAFLASGEVGCKYFLTDNVALSTAFVFEWATKDIYPDDNKMTDTDYHIDFGLRAFF
jgi:hypothetical protein